VIAKLNAALAASIDDPAVKDRFAQQSIEVVSGTSEAFGRLIEAETRHWQEVVKATGTKQE
jgi:tripartite-type tricarboxylate transporter receptor subunit TctC